MTAERGDTVAPVSDKQASSSWAGESIRNFEGRLATVSGPRRSGKTSSLLARAVALADTGASVVAVGATASAARAFGDAILSASSQASGLVRATTWSGLALDIRDRAGRPPRRLIGLEGHQRRVGELLAIEQSNGMWTRHWPTLHTTLASAIRQREIAKAVLDLQRSWLGHDEIVTHAEAVGCGPRWSELARFTERYVAWLEQLGEIDPVRLMVDAGLALRSGDGAAAYRRHCPHLVIDDFERADYASNRLLTMLAMPGLDVGGSVVVALDPHGAVWRSPNGTNHLTHIDRRLAAELTVNLPIDLPNNAPTSPNNAPTEVADGRPGAVTRSLARAHHRGLEADAIVGAVIDAHAGGTPWEDIVVVLPPTGGPELSSALRRVARRLAVPLGVSIATGDDPIVQAFAGVARWLTDGDQSHLAAALAMGMVSGPDDRCLSAAPRSGPTSAAVHAAWAALAPWLMANSGSDTLDLVTAFVNRAGADHASVDDGLAVHVPATGARVAVVAPRDIAGRSWDTVIITRGVDGVWPGRGAAGERFFDAALLDGPDVGEGPERNREEAQEWRRRFDEVVACATSRLVAIVAPEPGVLVSRFVEDWPATAITPQRVPRPAAVPSRPSLTGSDVPAFPTRRLRLSATQLDTYENCPLNYQFQYVAGIRGDGSVSASVGSIVHAALETFLLGQDRSFEALVAALDEHWDPVAFPYRPQEADYRMRADGWLRRWWTDELPRIAEVIAVEHRFTIEIGPHQLTGSIDRVSRDTDGLLEIVDYKTGTAPGGRIDGDNLQLATYHLAATRDPLLAAHGSPDRLRLHYLDSGGAGPLPHPGKDIDQPITPDHVERTEARILSTAAAILEERFDASVEASCDYCSFHRLCPLQPEGREVQVP